MQNDSSKLLVKCGRDVSKGKCAGMKGKKANPKPSVEEPKVGESSKKGEKGVYSEKADKGAAYTQMKMEPELGVTKDQEDYAEFGKFVGGRPYEGDFRLLQRYSNLIIQPEPKGSTLGYPLDSVEVLRYDTKGEKFDESDTHVLERLDNSAGNPVKEILYNILIYLKKYHRVDPHGFVMILKDGSEVKEFQRSFRHSDTKRLSRSDEVLNLKNFKKDATLKLFKSTNQERYEHVGPEVTRSHGGKIYKMAKRDYAWLMISRFSRSHSRQAKKQAQDLKFMITTSNHKINDLS
ncbi:hypothetical protein Tco_1477258 [Tanacetum coccineum]